MKSKVARLGARAVGLCAAWGIVIGYVVHTQLPANAVRLPGQDDLRSEIRRITPQGWAFFTRSAREPRLEIWRPAAGSRRFSSSAGQTRRLGGWNRAHRVEAGERGLITAAIPDGHWKTCTADVSTCLSVSRRWIMAADLAGRRTLCGEVGMARRQPVPWAWRNSRTVMPVSVAVVVVPC